MICRSDFGDLHADLVSQLGGLGNAVDDGLVDEDLRGGNGSGAAREDGIQEGADLALDAAQTRQL